LGRKILKIIVISNKKNRWSEDNAFTSVTEPIDVAIVTRRTARRFNTSFPDIMVITFFPYFLFILINSGRYIQKSGIIVIIVPILVYAKIVQKSVNFKRYFDKTALIEIDKAESITNKIALPDLILNKSLNDLEEIKTAPKIDKNTPKYFTGVKTSSKKHFASIKINNGERLYNGIILDASSIFKAWK